MKQIMKILYHEDLAPHSGQGGENVNLHRSRDWRWGKKKKKTSPKLVVNVVNSMDDSGSGNRC